MYINDLTKNSNPKLFADDTSIFCTVNNVAQSNFQLNYGLTKINEWAYNWKISFNPDYTKQVHEVVFSRKRTHRSFPMPSNILVKRVSFHKHLGLILNTKSDFDKHINPIYYGGGQKIPLQVLTFSFNSFATLV